MNVLVIGANGFLGRHLVRKVIDKGWNAICVYNVHKQFIPPECESYTCNEIEKINKKISAVFLLAAHIPYGALDTPTEQFIQTNIQLPLRIVNKFNDAVHVFSSSVAVYGRSKNVITEFSPFDNPTYYGKTKICSETIIQSSKHYRIIRFSSLYGKGMNDTTFIGRTIQQAKKQKQIYLFGDGSRMQNYIHVSDAAELLLKAFTITENQILLGVSPRSISNKDAALLIGKYMNAEIVYTGNDNSPSFLYDSSYTSSKLEHMTYTDFETGMKGMFQYE